MPQVDFDLCLITDRHQVKDDDLVAALEEALRGGVRCVQLREKDLTTRERFELAQRLRRHTHNFGAKLLINGDAALALATKADGVHLPQDGLPADVCRKLLGPDMLIGVSAHSVAEACKAERMGADFITFGPIYQTSSKAKYGPPVGLESLREACGAVRLPVLALGGIKPGRFEEILLAGASGAAMISAILAAADVESAATRILAGLREAASSRTFAKKKG